MRRAYSALIFCALLFCGCIAPLTPHNLLVRWGSDEPLKDRLGKSRQLIEERKKQAYSFTLAEKAAIFEAELEFFRLPEPLETFTARMINAAAVEHIGAAPSFVSENLVMLAFKYAATKDPASVKEAAILLEKFLWVDDQFGQRGQLPADVLISREPLAKTKENLRLVSKGKYGYLYFSDDAHGNTVAPHFLGAYLAYRLFDNPNIRENSVEIIRRNIGYLLTEGFVLKKLDGRPTTHGSLSGDEYWGFAKNALVARLMFLEVARTVLEESGDSRDKELLARINKDLGALSKNGVPEGLEKISPHIANFWFSTPSSNARIFRNFYLLFSVADSREAGNSYRRSFQYQWLQFREDHNPFLSFLYLSLIPIEQWTFKDRLAKAIALEYLKSAPLDRDDRELLNSFFDDDDIDIDRLPRVYKFKLEPKNKIPLPLYRRGIRRNEWSAEPHRLNEHLGENGSNLNSPIDFLTAYYLGLASGFIPIEEQKVDIEKVGRYLKEALPMFEKYRYKH